MAVVVAAVTVVFTVPFNAVSGHTHEVMQTQVSD